MDLEQGAVDAIAMDVIVAGYQIQQRNADFKILVSGCLFAGLERHVERSDLVGQRPDRDEIDTAFGIVAHGLERDAAARFGLAASGHLLDGQACHFGREVVEHDAVHASGGEDLVDVLQRADLALDRELLAPGLEVLADAVDRLLNAAGEVDVVVLQQDHAIIRSTFPVS